MKALRISNDLALPLDTVTATIVAYGGKGMGKTNLGSVLVEELTRCGLRWAWLDPLGVSWGLRHSADGKGPGVECLILGGPKGDVPIEPDGGAAVADVVIEEPHNVLIDFSRKPSGEMWSIGEKVRFVTAYALRLFQRQGELQGGRRREPLFQVLDEAARYIPQVIPSGAPEIARCVGAWEQLVEEGRNIGLGVGLMTQRSARMNKSVSELADVMLAFRTVGPNSLGAVMDWLGEHVEKARHKELSETVRALDRGHALVVSPGWLRFEGVVKVRMRETFDSSATVKQGERARTARGEGARPDLVAIRARMATQIEKAKAEDPRELKKKVADLERELRTAKKAQPPPPPVPKAPKRVEVLILKDAQIKRLEAAVKRLGESRVQFIEAQHAAAEKLHAQDERVALEMRALLAALAAAPNPKAMRGSGSRPALMPSATRVVGEGRPAVPSRPAPVVSRAPVAARRTEPHSDTAITGPQQKILDAAAFLEGVGVHSPDVVQLALFAGLSATGGYWRANIGRLRTLGLIEGTSLTADGRAAARETLIQTVDQLHQHVFTNLLTGPQRAILKVLVDAYPEGLSVEEVGQRANLEPAGGYWRANLGRLRSLGLVSKGGLLQALPVLFLEGVA